MNILLYLLLSWLFLSLDIFCFASQPVQAGTNNTMSAIEATAVVTRAYQDILHRDPETRGLKTFTAKLTNEGKDEKWLLKALRNSPEGQNRARERRRQNTINAVLICIPFACLLISFLRRKNIKDFLFKVTLLTLSIVFACMFLEIFLRMQAKNTGKRNENAFKNLQRTSVPKPGSRATLQNIIQLSAKPMIVYDLIPGISVQFMGGQMTTGPDGFRITPGSKEGTNAFCIIGLGDSVMFGWGVNDDETYLSCISRKLNSEGLSVPVKVINMCVPGYNTVMEVETLKDKGLQHHPKLVIIHFVENDLWLPNFICRESPDSELTRSYLLSTISKTFGGNLKAESFGRLADSPDKVPEKYSNMVGEKAFSRAMHELRALGASHGFKVILITTWEAPAFVRKSSAEAGFLIIELGPVIKEYSEKHGITEFQGSPLTISKKDPHFSAIAHELVSGKILEFLRKEKLLQ